MKITILGSCLILAFLLVTMPSVPAIQYTHIDTQQNNTDQLTNEMQKYVNNDQKKHPLLYLFVFAVYASRMYRGLFWSILAGVELGWGYRVVSVSHPLALVRSTMLFATGEFWWHYWLEIAEEQGWNW